MYCLDLKFGVHLSLFPHQKLMPSKFINILGFEFFHEN